MSEQHAEEPTHTLGINSGNGVQILLRIAWPGMALLVVIMLASVALPLGIAMHSGDGEIAQLIGKSQSISRLVALLVIVPSLVVLTMIDKINGAASVAALSAIAGYVLGGTAATGGP